MACRSAASFAASSRSARDEEAEQADLAPRPSRSVSPRWSASISVARRRDDSGESIWPSRRMARSSRGGAPVAKVLQIAGTARGSVTPAISRSTDSRSRSAPSKPPGERGEAGLPVAIRLLLLLGRGLLGRVLRLGHPVPVDRPVAEAPPGGGAVRVEPRDDRQVGDRLGLEPAILAPIGQLHLRRACRASGRAGRGTRPGRRPDRRPPGRARRPRPAPAHSSR